MSVKPANSLYTSWLTCINNNNPLFNTGFVFVLLFWCICCQYFHTFTFTTTTFHTPKSSRWRIWNFLAPLFDHKSFSVCSRHSAGEQTFSNKHTKLSSAVSGQMFPQQPAAGGQHVHTQRCSRPEAEFLINNSKVNFLPRRPTCDPARFGKSPAAPMWTAAQSQCLWVRVHLSLPPQQCQEDTESPWGAAALTLPPLLVCTIVY